MRAPDVVLKCDGPGCLRLPDKAPRIFVPAKPARGLPAVTLAFPHLSYCDACWNKHMKLDDLLTDRAKARIEERGRKIWPHDARPDFDAALIQPIDVFSPEYERYMKRLGFRTDGLGFSLHTPVLHPRMAR